MIHECEECGAAIHCRSADALRELTEMVEAEWPKLRDPNHRDHERAPHAGRRLRHAAEAARAVLDGGR